MVHVEFRFIASRTKPYHFFCWKRSLSSNCVPFGLLCRNLRSGIPIFPLLCSSLDIPPPLQRGIAVLTPWTSTEACFVLVCFWFWFFWAGFCVSVTFMTKNLGRFRLIFGCVTLFLFTINQTAGQNASKNLVIFGKCFRFPFRFELLMILGNLHHLR